MGPVPLKPRPRARDGNKTADSTGASGPAALFTAEPIAAGNVVRAALTGASRAGMVDEPRPLAADPLACGVCSARHADFVCRLGAEHVIDYTEQDFAVGSARYDLAPQTGGTYSPAVVRKVLARYGTLIQPFGGRQSLARPVGNIIKAVALNAFVGQTQKSFTAEVTTQALKEIGDLIESGRISLAIDRTYPLTDASAAVRLVAEGSPAGQVIMVEPPSPQPSRRHEPDSRK